ncbi:MAG: hypothetical protein V9G15_06130 [Dermatophilaceae bacterium]
MGLGDGDDLIVGVDGLRDLPWIDADGGERRDETAAVEDALDDGEHRVVDGDSLVELAAGEEVVDADRARALEGVLRGDDALLALDAGEIVGEGVEERGLDHPLEDGEAVALDAGNVGVDVCRREHGAPRTRPDGSTSLRHFAVFLGSHGRRGDRARCLSGPRAGVGLRAEELREDDACGRLFLGDLERRPLGDDAAAELATLRAELDDVIRTGDHGRVVLDDDERVAARHELVEDVDEAGDVGEVEARRGLVEDVEGRSCRGRWW